MSVHVLEEKLKRARTLDKENDLIEIQALLEGAIDEEDYNKYNLAIALLPYFKEFYLHNTRNIIELSYECNADYGEIDKYIVEYSDFMSLLKSEQIVHLYKGINVLLNKVGIVRLYPLFETVTEQMKQ